MRIAILAVILSLPASAEWRRHVMTPKGDDFDVAAPHSLSYFTRYPSLRDESGDFCYLCSLNKRLALARKQVARTEVRKVGTIRGLAIYDVLYFFDRSESPDWKSVLVRTQPGLFREIYHYQRNEGGIWPSFLVKVGDETLLGIEDDCYRQDIQQEYYWFGSDGAVRIDLSEIWAAAKAAAPEGAAVWKSYDGRVEFPAGRMHVGLIREPDWRCCSRGVIEVEFELRAGKAIVKASRFQPDAEFKWGGCR